ncbi:MAG: tetratricopeptide repeat protein, partial [Alphaproteobacteria bacterium]|nr:tetratricopeptide repeat protein [Alphaproteobacteria bacterium]
MKPLFVVILLLVLSFSHAMAQEDAIQCKIDSLLALITPKTSDIAKANIYNKIAGLSDNMDTTIKYASLSNALCDENDFETIGDNYYNIGSVYYLQDRSSEAISYFFKSLDYFLQGDNKKMIAFNYIGIGRSYVDLNLQDSSFFYLVKALDIFIDLKDTSNIAYTYQSIGIVNENAGFYATAGEYFQKAIEIDSLSHNYLDMAYDYQFLGYINQVSGNLDDAIKCLTKSAYIFDTIPTSDQY